jgi:YVTN family beta-propeller protein
MSTGAGAFLSIGARPAAPLKVLGGLLTEALGLVSETSKAPVGPVDSPLRWTILAAVRRELESSLAPFSSAPISAALPAATTVPDPPVSLGHSPRGILVSPNGKFIYTGNADGTVSVINAATDTLVTTIPTQNGSSLMAISPNGSRLYVANYFSNSVSVIDTSTNTVVATIPTGPNPQGVAFSPNGNTVYVTIYGAATVDVINASTNTITAMIPVGPGPGGAAISSNGSTLYVTNYVGNTVSVINTATNTVTDTINVGANPQSVAISPNGSTLYVPNAGDNTVSVINTSTNTVTATIPVGSHPLYAAVSPNGGLVYVSNFNDSTVSVINASTNTVVKTISTGPNPYQVALSPDGSQLYIATVGNNTLAVDLVAQPPSTGAAPPAGGSVSSTTPAKPVTLVAATQMVANAQPVSAAIAPAAVAPAVAAPVATAPAVAAPAPAPAAPAPANVGAAPSRSEALGGGSAPPVGQPVIVPPRQNPKAVELSDSWSHSTQLSGPAPNRSIPSSPSAITHSTPSITDILRHPEHLRDALAAGMVWTLLLVLATYSLQKTLGSRYGGWNSRVSRRFAGVSERLRHVFGFLHSTNWLPVVSLIGVNATVLSFVDPRFGFDATSVRLLASMTASSVLVTTVPCWLTIWLSAKRWGINVWLRGSMWGLLLAAGGVAVSRLIGFVPGLLSGQTYSFSQDDRTEIKRMPVLRLRAILTLSAGGICWIASSLVPGHGGTLTMFVHDLGVAGMTLALTSTLVELMPLTFLAGGLLMRTARFSWAVLMAITASAFALLVIPLPKYWLFVGHDVMRWLIIASVTMFAIVIGLGVLHRREVKARQKVG